MPLDLSIELTSSGVGPSAAAHVKCRGPRTGEVPQAIARVLAGGEGCRPAAFSKRCDVVHASDACRN